MKKDTGTRADWDSSGIETSADDWFNKGSDAYRNGEYDEAISFYLRSIELDPAAAAYYNLGNAYYDQGNLTKAIQSFEKAARLGHKGAQDWLKKNGHDW